MVLHCAAQVKGKLHRSHSEEGSGRGRNLFQAASDVMNSSNFRLPSDGSLQVATLHQAALWTLSQTPRLCMHNAVSCCESLAHSGSSHPAAAAQYPVGGCVQCQDECGHTSLALS
jgi:hypothetical protein